MSDEALNDIQRRLAELGHQSRRGLGAQSLPVPPIPKLQPPPGHISTTHPPSSEPDSSADNPRPNFTAVDELNRRVSAAMAKEQRALEMIRNENRPSEQPEPPQPLALPHSDNQPNIPEMDMVASQPLDPAVVQLQSLRGALNNSMGQQAELAHELEKMRGQAKSVRRMQDQLDVVNHENTRCNEALAMVASVPAHNKQVITEQQHVITEQREVLPSHETIRDSIFNLIYSI